MNDVTTKIVGVLMIALSGLLLLMLRHAIEDGGRRWRNSRILGWLSRMPWIHCAIVKLVYSTAILSCSWIGFARFLDCSSPWFADLMFYGTLSLIVGVSASWGYDGSSATSV